MEPWCRFIENGQDELLSCNNHEENAAKNSERFIEDLERSNRGRARIFYLITQRWTENEVNKVGQCKVLRVRDVAKGRGKLKGQIFS